MDVLVTGGTGFIGTHLCAELADRGHHVTALARHPDDADLPDGVEAVGGDVTDYDSIADAFEGQDVAYNLVSLSPLFKPSGGDAMHETVHLGGTENVVRAAEHHGVRKLVQVSGLGADPDAPTHFLRAKGRAEAVVRESDLAWTIVRPSVVFGDGGEFLQFTRMLTTPYVTALPGGGTTPFQPIWVGDFIPMLADTLDEAHDGQTYVIGGPEVLSLADVTRLVYRASGRSVTVLPVPMVLAGIGLSLADPLPFVPFGSDQYRSLRMEHTVAENDAATFGVEPEEMTTIIEYLGLER